MNQSPEKILSYLTGSNDLDSVSVENLQQLVADNPYFPVSRLLLTKKLKAEKEQYLSEVQKTALYFPNPYWLQLLLMDSDVDNLTISDDKNTTILTKEVVVPTAEVSLVESTSPTSIPSITDELSADSRSTITTSTGLKDALSQAEVPEHTPTYEVAEQGSTNRSQAEEEAATISRGVEDVSNQQLNHFDTKVDPGSYVHSIRQAQLPAEAETEIVEYKEEMAGVAKETDTATSQFLKELAPPDNTSPSPHQDDEHDKMFQNIKAMLDASVEEAGADTRHAAIPMDPYYTIDYFASQGIKLELEHNPQDQLGQHLKKFTHWLKHMKKLGPEDATEAIRKTNSDADIQQIADSSNTVREVVTEAMALVLEKQGKKEKAIELYNKLSFLNPDKSTYFADKIKKLKGS